jgi:hypothetical protein
MSDTPRTDAVEFAEDGAASWVVSADFARQLERELATTKLALANLLSDGDVTDRNHARMLLTETPRVDALRLFQPSVGPRPRARGG